MAVRPVPKGYTAVTPTLTFPGARRFLEFAKKVFGAKVEGVMDGPSGEVSHAELTIDGAKIMVGEPMGPHGPRPGSLYLYVRDADATYRKAVAAGAKPVMPLADQFWGDRGGCVEDEFGNVWWICTRTEDLSPKEIGRRAEAFFASQAGGSGPEATSVKKPAKSEKSKVVAKGGARGKVAKKIEPPSVAARRRNAPLESAIPTAGRVIQAEAKTMENPGHMGVGGTAPPAPPPVWREELRPAGVPEAAQIPAPTPRRRRR
jgi:PhnB protein